MCGRVACVHFSRKIWREFRLCGPCNLDLHRRARAEYAFGGFGRVGHDDGAPYMRLRDKSICGEYRTDGPGVTYFQLIPA